MTISPDIFEDDNRVTSGQRQVASTEPQTGNNASGEFKQVDYTPKLDVCHLSLATSALPCDSYHHYYHYQSSAQYLWLAHAYVAAGRPQDADLAYEKAIFQDHFNEEALKRCKGPVSAPSYDKYPDFDAEFCISVGEAVNAFTQTHDEAANAYLAGNYELALALITERTDTGHSNSFFLAGKCLFMRGEYEKSIADFSEAIRLSHLSHDAYHRVASDQHRLRGERFFSAGEIDLAISDFTKSLDLYKGNKETRKARAVAYYAKGSIKLAQQDEIS